MYLQAKAFSPENILDSWKDRKGKFVKTFGMNTKRNKNEWLATWDSIKENIHTAIGMPGIAYEECDDAGCSLTHVEADTYEENVEKQKPFIKTKIIDYVLDEDEESVDLIHEITDESFFEELQKGILLEIEGKVQCDICLFEFHPPQKDSLEKLITKILPDYYKKMIDRKYFLFNYFVSAGGRISCICPFFLLKHDFRC